MQASMLIFQWKACAALILSPSLNQMPHISGKQHYILHAWYIAGFCVTLQSCQTFERNADSTLTGFVKTIHVTPSLHGGVVKLPLQEHETSRACSAGDNHRHTDGRNEEGLQQLIRKLRRCSKKVCMAKGGGLCTYRQSRTCLWATGLQLQKWCYQVLAHSPTYSRLLSG